MNRCAAHTSDERRSLDELRASLDYGPAALPNDDQFIFILDDVLTTGRSFKVVKQMVHDRMPAAQIIGIFVARCARPSIEWDFAEL